MAGSNKPIIWGLFAAGGTVSAFVIPVLIVVTYIAQPMGWLSPDALSYERLSAFLQGPLTKLIVFGVLFLTLWHAAHRMRITAHDLGVTNDRWVMMICYGVAALGTLVMAYSLIRI